VVPCYSPTSSLSSPCSELCPRCPSCRPASVLDPASLFIRASAAHTIASLWSLHALRAPLFLKQESLQLYICARIPSLSASSISISVRLSVSLNRAPTNLVRQVKQPSRHNLKSGFLFCSNSIISLIGSFLG
jgi:hypothetical protein